MFILIPSLLFLFIKINIEYSDGFKMRCFKHTSHTFHKIKLYLLIYLLLKLLIVDS